MWLQSYEWEKIRHALNGMLFGYKVKKLAIDKEDATKSTLKLAGESVYLALKLLFMSTDFKTPPPFKIYELIEKTECLTLEQRTWIKEMIDRRIADKKADYFMTDEFNALVD